MRKALALGYGVVAYLAFLGVFAAFVGFVGGAHILRGIDGGKTAASPLAVGIDLALITLFGVSHSVMARPGFKERWVRVVSRSAERSTYVLVASLVLALLAWQWRALPGVVWNVAPRVSRLAVWGVSGAGVLLVVVSTFLTDHFDLFGLRQTWLYVIGRPYTPVPFRERGLYKVVRHPMMVGVLLWFWATPTMSVGHLIFALAMSVYVFVGVAFEERQLARSLGEPYQAYRARVRAFLP
jgi:protein-S-isoprenylcysteine O-methyltransferase Ste14